jgi:L-asparaginase
VAPDDLRPRVLVLTLGGTIASTGRGGVAPRLSGEGLVAAVPGLAEVADLTVEEVARVPSGDIGVDLLFEVAARTRSAHHEGVAGVVVVQGTDTMEETAFALELLAGTAGPIVVTGAMRAPESPGADGPANLLAAVRVAAADAARGLGAVVVMSDEVYAARWVRKTHASSPGAFASPGRGPIGEVVEGVVRIWNRPAAFEEVAATRAGRVALLSATLGGDGREFDGLAQRGVEGVVVAAFGVGHVPAAMAEALGELVREVPVLLATRTGAGRVHASTYVFTGSESDLLARGLMSAGALDGPKAAGLLSLLLGTGAPREEIARRVADVVERV